MRERILTVRLLEKAARDPSYLQNLGVELIVPELRQDSVRCKSRDGSRQNRAGEQIT